MMNQTLTLIQLETSLTVSNQRATNNYIREYYLRT